MAEGKEKQHISRNLIRAVAFLCIVAAALAVCEKTFSYDDAERSYITMEEFYDLDKNTVDCICFGSSAIQRGWVVPVSYHDNGVASYSMTCGTQAFVMTRFLMEESLKTQNPKLFVVELRATCKDASDLPDVSVRRMLDNMKPSMTKMRAIRAILDYASHGENSIDTTGLSYYIPFIKYHSLWNPSKQPKYLDLDYYLGYALDPDWSMLVYDAKIPEFTEKAKAIAPEVEEEVNRLLDYCDSLDADVLFVISPYEATVEGMEKLNYTSRIVRDRDYEVLNFLQPDIREKVGIDEHTCFYNKEHLNYYRSVKYTHFLSEYIKQNYDVPGRRGDDTRAVWEGEYNRLENNLLEGKYSDKYREMNRKIEAIEGGEQ